MEAKAKAKCSATEGVEPPYCAPHSTFIISKDYSYGRFVMLKVTKVCWGGVFAARWIGLIVLIAIILSAGPVWACPNCQESLATGPNAFNLVRGFFWSIVFMMSMPFMILGGLCSYFYWEVRKARARTTQQTESPSLGEIT